MAYRVEAGDVFGKLEVIKTWVDIAGGKKQTICECRCECGNSSFITRATNLRNNHQYHCGCIRLLIGKENPKWNGYEDISKRYWDSIVYRAKAKHFELTITIEYIWDLFIKQNRKCALTGIDLQLPIIYREQYTASLDRIDSNLGYIEGNVQWVHGIVNKMKRHFNQEHFMKWCKIIADYNESKNVRKTNKEKS